MMRWRLPWEVGRAPGRGTCPRGGCPGMLGPSKRIERSLCSLCVSMHGTYAWYFVLALLDE